MLGALKPSAYLAKPKFSCRRECSVEKTEVCFWEIIPDNLSKAGWSWGWVSAIDPNGRTTELLTCIAAMDSGSWCTPVKY